MAIPTVHRLDALNPERPTLVLHTPETLATNLAKLDGFPLADWGLTADVIPSDEVIAYSTAKQRLIFVGLGAKAKLEAEGLRKGLHKALEVVRTHKWPAVQVLCLGLDDEREANLMAQALGEVPILSGYQFLVHKTGDQAKPNPLAEVYVMTDLDEAMFLRGQRVAEATCHTRDLVNEPPNVLTAEELANRAKQLGEQYGFSAQVLDMGEIQSLKMGGLLAVNRGSPLPPTFTILEWKPANPTNSQPVVLVGKGVVFDTGGLSLKPTAGSMDSMKSDMAGAGAVIGAFVALALNQVNLHVVGLIPATDNRPGGNAYTPNDVVTMMDGTTVEVLNTDAEGRMILADALHYAKRYNPELVIDLATLTGAAAVAVGEEAIAMMGTTDSATKAAMLHSGYRVHERLVEFPLWAEYGELLKSPVADRKNVGPRLAGAITAGKFLEHFTGGADGVPGAEGYPWLHLDIAGPAFLDKPSSYRGKGGTGVGVRLLLDFLAGRV